MDRSQAPLKKRRSPLRVMHLFRNVDVGGAELRMLDIARRIDRSNFELHYCTFSGRDGALADELRILGGKFHITQLGPKFPAALKKILQQQEIHVVHAHMHYSSGFALRIAAQAGTKGRIAHFQSCTDGQADGVRRQLQRKLMRRWINKYGTHILACGENVMSRTWHSDWKNDPRCRVIFDGIDPTPFQEPVSRAEVAQEFQLNSGCKIFINVVNFRMQKNQGRLLSVFAEVVKQQPNSCLLLVGRDISNSEAALRSQVAQLGISKQVVFTGPRDDVPRLMRAADAMIFTSLIEGLPGVLMEACAAGTPVLASNLPENQEVAACLPLVKCLSLEASDMKWASHAVQLANNDRDLKKATRDFNASPFHCQKLVDDSCGLWQEAALVSQTHDYAKAA